MVVEWGSRTLEGSNVDGCFLFLEKKKKVCNVSWCGCRRGDTLRSVGSGDWRWQLLCGAHGVE